MTIRMEMEMAMEMATEMEIDVSMAGRMVKCIALTAILGLGMSVLSATMVQAQTDITFQVDLTDVFENHEYDPQRDRVELIGSHHPLSATRPLEMTRDEDEPTLFKLTVSFPMSAWNSRVDYQFRALINGRYMNEDIPRTVRITSENKTLDALYFNSYAW